MLKYFLSLLKKRIPIIFAITAMFLVLTIVINNTHPYIEMTYINGIIGKGPKKGFFDIFTYGLAILGVILPIIEYSFKMVKIQAHQAYSFPIKRGQLFLSRYLIGLIEIFISFTISYFVSVILVLTSDNMYDTSYFYIYYPMALASGILVFTFFSFIYCRANNIIDGILSMALAFVGILSIGLVISAIFDKYSIKHVDAIYYSAISPLMFVRDFCEANLINRPYFFTIDVLVVGIWLVIDLALVIIEYFFNQRIKTEDITNVSNSLFCYKLFLPIASVGLIIYLTLLLGFWSIFLGLLFSVSIFILYMRGFEMEEKRRIYLFILLGVDVIVLITTLVLQGVGLL